ncbi:hypothetical protein P9112_001988 [Eukaryota sp. TZLM1-RC]
MTISLPYCLNEYVLEQLLHEGRQGTVYSGLHSPSGRKLVFKLLPMNCTKLETPESAICYELVLLKYLQHPLIVTLYEAISLPDATLMVMEYCAGSDLFNVVSRKGRFNSQTAGRILFFLVAALEYIHSQRVYHRDLKLENILLDDKGTPKLCDFGLSIKTKQKLNSRCGSPHYCSPEVYAQKEFHGAPADVYSLGVCLFVLLTGRYPYDHRSLSRLSKLVREGNLRFPSCIPPSARELLQGMLYGEPNKRFSLSQIKSSSFYRQFCSMHRIPPPATKLTAYMIVQGPLREAIEHVGISVKSVQEELRRGNYYCSVIASTQLLLLNIGSVSMSFELSLPHDISLSRIRAPQILNPPLFKVDERKEFVSEQLPPISRKTVGV